MSTNASHVAEALFGRIRRELLTLLLLNPERSFFLLELVALLRTGRGGVQRELASLTECGLALMERLGSRTYYRAAPDAALLPGLTSLLREASDPARLLEAFVAGLDRGVYFALRSPASIDASGRPVIELLLAGRLPPEDPRSGLERVELLSGSRIREVVVLPEALPEHLLENGNAPWLSPGGGTLLRGAWPEGSAREPDAPREAPPPDLFSSMGLDWDR